MKKIEQFLNSRYYIALIFLITLVAWSFYKETPPHAFNIYNMTIVYFLIFLNALILGLFKNTLYSVPILFSFLFIINQSDITFENANEIGFPMISTLTLIAGYSVYFIRFKPSIKLKKFALGFLLIAISYVIPLIYMPYSLSSLSVSLMGFVYFGFYIFYSNTMEGNMKYLFTVFLMINLLLVFQVSFYLYQGFILNPSLPLDERITVGWGRNLGWGNINDVCFYIALTLPSHLYFIYRKPHSFVRWLLVLLPIFAIILTKSRGGLLGLVIVLAGLAIFMLKKGFKIHLKYVLIGLGLIIFIGVLAHDILWIWIQTMNEKFALGLDGFTSYRLFIYDQAWHIFLEYPIFGAGWLSITRVFEAWLETFGAHHRIFMYHSTLFQALAAMGLFGLFALIVHYKQILTFFSSHVTLEKNLFIIGYLATQIHGLIENVQYSVPYSVLIVIILSIFETAKHPTDFEMVNGIYHLQATTNP